MNYLLGNNASIVAFRCNRDNSTILYLNAVDTLDKMRWNESSDFEFRELDQTNVFWLEDLMKQDSYTPPQNTQFMYIKLALIMERRNERKILILTSLDKEFHIISCKSAKAIYDATIKELNKKAINFDLIGIQPLSPDFVPSNYNYGSIHEAEMVRINRWNMEVLGLPKFEHAFIGRNPARINKKQPSATAIEISSEDEKCLCSSIYNTGDNINIKPNIGDPGMTSIMSGKRVKEIIKKLKVQLKNYQHYIRRKRF